MNEEIFRAARAVSESLNADVVFYSGQITQAEWLNFRKQCADKKKYDNILLLLVSPGGDPDAAYKIGRLLQSSYKKISVFISGWCKSAGTLIAISSSTLYISDTGELGPLDIQLAKQDELDEMASGLLLEATMKTLEQTASRMFINLLKTIRRETGISTKLASHLSADMVVGLLDPVFAQVEPMKIGEIARAMNITRAYGLRLAQASKSLSSPQMLDFLVTAYPDHGFVIDREEAGIIFRDVRKPTAELVRLASARGDMSLVPRHGGSGGCDACVEYLSSSFDSVEVSDGGDDGSGKNRDAEPKGRRDRGEGERSAVASGERVSGAPDYTHGDEVASVGQPAHC